MCLRFMFLLITRLAAWVRLSRREEMWKTAEIFILRHQLGAVCGCPVTGVRLPAVPRLRRRPRLRGPRLIFAAGIGASEDFLSGPGHRRARFR